MIECVRFAPFFFNYNFFHKTYRDRLEKCTPPSSGSETDLPIVSSVQSMGGLRHT